MRGMRILVPLFVGVVACGRTGLDVLSEQPSGIDASGVDASDAGFDSDGSPNDDGPAADVTDGSPAPTCDPSNCMGCCEADGTCVTDISEKACGEFGEKCVACAPGDFCKGACIRPQPNCGPSNCSGCCINEGGYCTDGTFNVACGTNGQLCQNCPSQGDRCIAQVSGGGLCGGVQSCGPQNCEGCCDGNVCHVGVDDSQCGTKGAACQACDATEQCVPTAPGGGECEQTTNCSPQNCNGCCYGKVCAVGDQDVACGIDGEACVDCGSLGTHCSAGTCG